MQNLFILTLCQALGMSAAPLVILLGGIVGANLAPSTSLATLPVASIIIGTALSTIPAALLMQRIGRKLGFLVATIISALSTLMAAWSLSLDSFWLFCFSCALLGNHLAFIQQYRFAAAESVPVEKVGKAISWLLLGGLFAAWIGPEIAVRGRHLIDIEYAGGFLYLGVLNLITFCILLLGFKNQLPITEQQLPGRPLKVILAQPNTLLAIGAAAIGYGFMSLIMTATPISMHHMDGFSLESTKTVIQNHIMSMFLPSLFSAWLLRKLNIKGLMLIGIACYLACILATFWDRDFAHYLSGLILLGVGWNFLFVSGTALLTQQYRPNEAFKVQATNDFIVSSLQAICALSAGALISGLGWSLLNLAGLPILILLGAYLLLSKNNSDAIKQA
jgi:MFS family permease